MPLGWLGHRWLHDRQPQQRVQAPISARWEPVGIPGARPGRVVEVKHPATLRTEEDQGYRRRDADVIRRMLDRGMRELVGCEEAIEAWRFLFQPGDLVGIKVVPVGKPDSISSYELVHEVVKCLGQAGVPRKDILVFDRYKVDFMAARYHEHMPEGVRWECCSATYDTQQLEIDGQTRGQPKERNVAGYDRDVYRELPFCDPTTDRADDRRFRSHLSRIVTHSIDKFISLPVLKDHRSSGVTLALKNLSHGLVNNVARSHMHHKQWEASTRGKTINQCGVFIPAMVSLPPTREKAVLQILDGIVGTWEGGPGAWNASFATWNYGSLFFATDPVAMDHIGWEIVNAKRRQQGWPDVEEMGIEGKNGWIERNGKPVLEQFPMRQPEHIPLASNLGLGVFDYSAIEHKECFLG